MPIKNQHYVPQSYLKNFSDKKRKLWVFDKFNNKKFQSHISNVASETYFYDFPQDGKKEERDQYIEKFFSELESRSCIFTNHIFKKIKGVLNLKNIEKVYSTEVLTQDQKLDFAYLVAIQALRTKEFREFYTEMWQKTKPWISSFLEYEVLNSVENLNLEGNQEFLNCIQSLKLEYNEDNVTLLKNIIKEFIFEQCWSGYTDLQTKGITLSHAIFIFEKYKKLTNILVNHIWLVGVNDTEEIFFTSDHPVVKHNRLNLNGYSSEGIEIVYPINNNLILIILDKTYFHPCINLDRKLIKLTREDVGYYNSLQVFSSYRFVFSHNKNLSLAENMCKSNPALCSPNQERSQLQVNYH